MNNTNEPVGIGKGLSTLERARFGPGMLLQHEDLEQLNNYTRSLSRLLFRSFFGCGVICGLVIEAVEECEKLKVTAQPGVALTCAGDPVHVPRATAAYTKENFKQDVWVKLCATIKCCAPRPTTCSSDDDETTSDCTRERDAFEIQLVTARPDCACACPKDLDRTGSDNDDGENKCMCADIRCHQDHYDGVCGCGCGDCSECDCQCVLLAYVHWDDQNKKWLVDHSVRRFIRPVLMRDPQVEKDKAAPGDEGAKVSPELEAGAAAPQAAMKVSRKK